MGRTREQITGHLVALLRDVRPDFDQSIPITEATGIFRDLGFESIDAIGLSTALEARFNQTFPFPEFMMAMKQEKAPDITVGQLLDFLEANILDTDAPGSAEDTSQRSA